MHITLIAPGSQGDVRPFVALGERLWQAGHRVRQATHSCYRPLARAHDLAFFLAAVVHHGGAGTTAAGDSDLPARAAALGRRLRAEDGVGRAVTLLEAYFQREARGPQWPGRMRSRLAMEAGRAAGR